mgnify:CR=1 FL=1
MTEQENTFQTAMDAGVALSENQNMGVNAAAIIPAGYKIEDLEKYQETPKRIREKFAARTLGSFLEYFKQHRNEASVIMADDKTTAFSAIFDYHTKYAPAWCDHKATYTCPNTVEWSAWIEKDRRRMDQTTFAAFIEENLLSIVEPDSATFLEISRSLEAKKSVDFNSSVRLDNGAVEFKYEETIAGTASKGAIQIPAVFYIGVAPFKGGPTYKVEARLRYRLDASKLSMWYELVRPHAVLDDAFADVVAKIERATEIKVLIGSVQP